MVVRQGSAFVKFCLRLSVFVCENRDQSFDRRTNDSKSSINIHDVSLKKTSHNPPPSHLHHNHPPPSLPHHLPPPSHSPLPIPSIPRPPPLTEMPPSMPPTILRDIRNAAKKNPQVHSTGRLALWWMSGA